MASVISESNGRKRIEFTDAARTRKRIRLGKVDRKSADAVKVKMESLVGAQVSGQAADLETTRWVMGLDDTLYDKLSGVGLVPPRESLRLGPWLDSYLEGRGDLKPESLRKLKQTREKLLEYFPRESVLRKITREQASKWRETMMVGGGVGEATAKTHAGNAKTFFNEAVQRKIIPENPFSHLSSGRTAAANDRYVTPEEAGKVIDYCTDARFKLIFALARYAGLRTPSESFALRWGDINWDRGRLNVRSKKTERFVGHERRTVPMVPALRKILEDALVNAADGEEFIVTMKHSGYVGKRMADLIRLAGVEPWDDLFQTLRRSCEIEWAMEFPQFAVSKWIGHSIVVSGKHYANLIPDELYDRVAGVVKAEEKPREARNAARSAANKSVQQGKVRTEEVGDSPCMSIPVRELAAVSDFEQVGVEGLEPPTRSRAAEGTGGIPEEAARNQARPEERGGGEGGERWEQLAEVGERVLAWGRKADYIAAPDGKALLDEFERALKKCGGGG